MADFEPWWQLSLNWVLRHGPRFQSLSTLINGWRTTSSTPDKMTSCSIGIPYCQYNSHSCSIHTRCNLYTATWTLSHIHPHRSSLGDRTPHWPPRAYPMQTRSTSPCIHCTYIWTSWNGPPKLKFCFTRGKAINFPLLLCHWPDNSTCWWVFSKI